MTRLLKALGLMAVAEHERIVASFERANRILETAAENHLAKYKKAISDLEDQVRKRGNAEAALSRVAKQRDDLRPDALAMRRKREKDRDRAAGKRGKDNG